MLKFLAWHLIGIQERWAVVDNFLLHIRHTLRRTGRHTAAGLFKSCWTQCVVLKATQGSRKKVKQQVQNCDFPGRGEWGGKARGQARGSCRMLWLLMGLLEGRETRCLFQVVRSRGSFVYQRIPSGAKKAIHTYIWGGDLARVFGRSPWQAVIMKIKA